MSFVQFPKKDWLLYCCALCGEPFPLGPRFYANMSSNRRGFRMVLDCPCDTRRPPEPPPPVVDPRDPFKSLNGPEFKRELLRLEDDNDLQAAVERALKGEA